MLRVSEAEIERAAGRNALEAGRAYFRQARVVGFERDGDVIRSRVKGSTPRPYQQVVRLQNAGDRTRFTGSCDCPVGMNCKHVVAALLHAETIAAAAARAVAPALGSFVAAGGTFGFRIGPAADAAAPAPPELPPQIAAWLDELDRAATASEDYPDTVRHRLVYVLKPVVEGLKQPMLGVQVISARLDKLGGWTAYSQPYVGANPPREQHHADFVRPSDLAILRLLGRVRHLRADNMSALGDDTGAEILAKMLATGRTRWLALDGLPLRAGEPRRGRIAWQAADATTLAPRLEAEDGAEALGGTPPVYVDADDGLVGPLDTGHPAAVAGTLCQAPPVPALAVEALHRRLAGKAPALAALAPPIPTSERLDNIDPVPVLRLTIARVPLSGGARYDRLSGAYQTHEDVAVGRPSFRYGPMDIPASERQTTVTRYAAGRLLTVERRPQAEAAAFRALHAHGFTPLRDIRAGAPPEHALSVVPDGDALAWYDALYHAVPALRAAGWQIEIAPEFPIRLVRGDGPLDAEIAQGSGIDWLELHLGIAVDGERIDLVEPIVRMISAPGFSTAMLEQFAEDDDDPVFVALADGRTLAVPLGRLRPIVRAIHDLALGAGGGDGRLRLSRFDAAALAEFEAATAGQLLAWRGGEAIRDLGRRLTAHGGVPPVAVPPGFRAALRPYQADGVAWLSLLLGVGLGGILADDMGLGKTVQALALVAIEKAEGRLDRPALVVAPTSLMANWRREAERFAPDLRVLTLHGLGRKALFDRIGEHDLVLTTYPLIARDHAALKAVGWHVLLLDEAQTIKNPDATTTRLIATIEARHRFCLTGTPLENNLGELWSLFAFACPGLLGERKRFNALWRNPIEKGGDGERGRLLARRVRPFLLRRTKEEVARDLPPKTEIVERIEFAPAQRDVYESIRLSMHRKVRDAIAERGWARSRIVILDALLKLRQACCDPRLLRLKSKAATGSAKLERLEGMLEELLAEGRRVIVFSQFTSMLDLIRPRLDAAGIVYALLTGQTRDRPAALAAFQSGAARVFLISLKAGGTGLNLVEADTVILYDPWWNPAVEAQAIDRAHRIGQTKPVFVHKLVALDTIEEKMEVLKERKGALAASLFDPGGEPTLAMTEADMEALLGA